MERLDSAMVVSIPAMTSSSIIKSLWGAPASKLRSTSFESMRAQCGPSKQKECLTPGGGPIVVANVQKCSQQYTRSVVKARTK